MAKVKIIQAWHSRLHSIISTLDHSSTATPGRILEADGNGLPIESANTDAELADAVAKRHTQGTDTALGVLGTKNPPIDADKALYRDSAAGDALVTSTWTQIKAFLKTYFDTIYGAIGLAHARLHSITSILDHSSTATPNQILKADANGLPVDASNTDGQVAVAVAAAHARQHSIISAPDHTSAATPGKMLQADANGLPVDGTNTNADVADAVAKKHTQGTDTALGAVGVKNPPIDADKAMYRDSAAADALVTSTWTQIKAFLKTYWDTLYEALGSVATHAALTTGIHGVGAAYIAKSTTDGLNLAAHVSRHQWLGADEIDILDLLFKYLCTVVYKSWDEVGGFTAGGTGTAPSFTGFWLRLATGATSGKTSYVYGAVAWTQEATSLMCFAYPNVAPAAETVYMGFYTNPTAPTDVEKHLGFKIVNGVIYATSGNGVNHEEVNTGLTAVLNTPSRYYIKRVSGNVYFYVDNVLKATLNTYVTLTSNTYPLLHIVNSAAVNHTWLTTPIVYLQG